MLADTNAGSESKCNCVSPDVIKNGMNLSDHSFEVDEYSPYSEEKAMNAKKTKNLFISHKIC